MRRRDIGTFNNSKNAVKIYKTKNDNIYSVPS